MGAIAALKAKGQKIGFIGGINIPLIQRFENGFKGGAMYVNTAYRQEGIILSQYISKEFEGFNDPTGGYNIASALYKQGAAVIYHAAGGSGDGLFRPPRSWASSPSASTPTRASSTAPTRTRR